MTIELRDVTMENYFDILIWMSRNIKNNSLQPTQLV